MNVKPKQGWRGRGVKNHFRSREKTWFSNKGGGVWKAGGVIRVAERFVQQFLDDGWHFISKSCGKRLYKEHLKLQKNSRKIKKMQKKGKFIMQTEVGNTKYAMQGMIAYQFPVDVATLVELKEKYPNDIAIQSAKQDKDDPKFWIIKRPTPNQLRRISA